MNSFAFCTSFYESARPYLEDCMRGIIRAGEGHDCAVVVAIDGLRDSARTLEPLAAVMPVHTVDVAPGASIAKVREAMLRCASTVAVDALVLIDADDWPLEAALDLHGERLETASFSYGDMKVVNAEGVSLNRMFYSGSDIPEETADDAQILDRNWLGFSNTAFRREDLQDNLLSIPESITAVDWWFYTTLLRNGARGLKTRAPVVAYRMHDQNILGASPGMSVEDLRARCKIVLRHYEAAGFGDRTSDRAEAIRHLDARLASPNEELLARIRETQSKPGVWHEDVLRLASPVSIQ